MKAKTSTVFYPNWSALPKFLDSSGGSKSILWKSWSGLGVKIGKGCSAISRLGSCFMCIKINHEVLGKHRKGKLPIKDYESQAGGPNKWCLVGLQFRIYLTCNGNNTQTSQLFFCLPFGGRSLSGPETSLSWQSHKLPAPSLISPCLKQLYVAWKTSTHFPGRGI